MMRAGVAPYRLYQVGFRWVHSDSAAKVAELDGVFGGIGDWLRYNPLTWFIWTQQNPDQIYETVRTHMHPDDTVLIVNVDPNGCRGWAPKWVWDWFGARINKP